MSIESSGGFHQEETDIEQPESIQQIESKEKLPPEQSDILIFDAPFHSDPELSGQALDDSGMSKEIPRGALSVATLLGRKGFEANVVPMDAFINQDFIGGRDEINQIIGDNFAPTEQESTQQLQRGVANEVFFVTKMRETVHKLIEERNPKVIAFSYMFSPTERSVLAMARYIKQNFPDTLVVIGGNAASFDENSRKQMLSPEGVGADAIIDYEGEWTMLDLMEEMKKQGEDAPVDLSSIKGLSYWGGEEVKRTGRRERGNPVEIGPLNYDKVILPEGTDIGDFNHYVLFARGCLGRCAFCTSSEMYRHFITNIGLESFREELGYVAEAVNKREGREKNVGILDDDLLLELWFDADGKVTDKESEAVEKKTVFEVIEPILKEIHQQYPDINFIAQARVGHLRGRENEAVEKRRNPRANTLIGEPERVLGDMRESGVNFVLLGIESGSQEILDASLKDTEVEWVEPACRRLKEAGIGVGAFWIIGLPGATKEREEQSLAFLKKLVDEGLISELEAHVFVPLPGTSARKSKVIGRDLKFDADLEETSKKALFSDQATYEHVDSEGNVVLSKEEIQDIFERTKELAAILKKKNGEEGKDNVVKP
ncbi:MAG: radical SAM protein [Patescibacteria group bacterium]